MKAQEKDENPAAVAKFLAAAKGVLESVVEDVRVSDRLSESPACLIAPDFGLDLRLQQILAPPDRRRTRPSRCWRSIRRIRWWRRWRHKTGDKALFEDAVWLLFDEARVMDGEAPHDAAAFAARLIRVLGKAAADETEL